MTAPDGLVLAGFGLDHQRLPAGWAPVLLSEVDQTFQEAGMSAGPRWSPWNRMPYTDGGYVVATDNHHRSGDAPMKTGRPT